LLTDFSTISARSRETFPKKWCPLSIISSDEYWFAVGGNGGVISEGGAAGGIVPVVWATTDVDAKTAITPATAAARKLRIMAASLALAPTDANPVWQRRATLPDYAL
jgi:hypothetical protein